MRVFSQLNTNEALDVAIEITPAISNIVEDENLVAELRKTMPEGKVTKAAVMHFGMTKIVHLMPILLKTHRVDVYSILAPFNGMSAEEIGKQNFVKTCMQVRSLVQDKGFMDFFKSSLDGEQNM